MLSEGGQTQQGTRGVSPFTRSVQNRQRPRQTGDWQTPRAGEWLLAGNGVSSGVVGMFWTQR